jgi:putative membrane protein
MLSKESEKWIKILGIAVPVLVAVLLGVNQKIDLGTWTHTLPHVIALLNSLTAVLLVLAFVAVKNKNIALHKLANTAAFYCGALFLVLYILYHISNKSASSASMPQAVRMVYLFLLVSHIVLSVVVVRFVLFAMYYGYTGQIERHKRVVKIAFPIWLYVSVSGVLVYWLISPYYK